MPPPISCPGSMWQVTSGLGTPLGAAHEVPLAEGDILHLLGICLLFEKVWMMIGPTS